MKTPHTKFSKGSYIAHLLVRLGISTNLKKSIDADVGDWIVIRAVSPGVISFEKLIIDNDQVSSDAELAEILIKN